ncbi:MAG: glycosyltransferase, partial [bacterium]
DRNEALLELFHEDWDIVCYDTPEEAIDKSKYYLKHESERLAIARRGRQKVVQSHTFEKRINHILNKTGLR